jgi:hypothetical protein
VNKTLLIIVGLLCSLAGCASSPDSEIGEHTGSIVVPKKAVVCISTPDDVSHKGSGMAVTKAVQRPLLKDYNLIAIKSNSEEAVAECLEIGGDYLLEPEIIHYEDRVTGWSGQPDIIKVKVTLTYIATSDTSSFSYYADSNLFVSSLFEWGNSPASDLLGSDFSKQVARLMNGSM